MKSAIQSILEQDWARLIEICPRNNFGYRWEKYDFHESNLNYLKYRLEIINQVLRVVLDESE